MTSPNLPATPFTSIRAVIGGEEVDAVDSRALHTWLQSGYDFSDWFKRRRDEALLLEGVDFDNFAPEKTGAKTQDARGGSNRKDYVLTVDAAMHIAMLEHTEIGRMVRQDAIEWKKRAKAMKREHTRTDEEVLISLGVDPASATMLVANRRKMEALAAQQAVTDAKSTRALELATIAEAKSQATAMACQDYSIMAYSRLCNIPVDLSTARNLGVRAATLSRERGFPIGKARDPRFGSVNTYIESVLQEVFTEGL